MHEDTNTADRASKIESHAPAWTHALIREAADCIVVIDKTGAILEFNRAATATLGFPREEAIGKNVADLIVPATFREEHRRGLAGVVKGGEGTMLGERVRTRALRADGSEVHVELTITSIGEPESPIFAAVIRDITEEESAQDALIQSQRTLMTLMSNLPGMAYRCRDGRYWELDFVSEGCEELTGYEAHELVEGPDFRYGDLIHPEDRDRVWEEVRAALKERQSFQVLYRIRTKDGEEKWLLERGRGIYSVFSETGELITLEGFVTDITERKQAEELLSDYSQTLEAEVAERTDELEKTHEQLMIQEKMASLGALTAGIAHEIMNPLNFVNNFARMSVELALELQGELANQKDRLDEAVFESINFLVNDLAENAARIQDHGTRADRIMKSMLMHSRSSSKERQLTDINQLLEEDITLAFHGLRAQDKTFNITIKKHFEPSLDPISVIPQDIGRVFLNIINNACFAAHRKKLSEGAGFSPQLTVHTEQTPDSVIVRIRDNGMGMTEEVASRVFNPFFTTKPTGDGTGLGLSIAYDIVVQEHGGTIRLDTQEGEGTEFIITIPKEPQTGTAP